MEVEEYRFKLTPTKNVQIRVGMKDVQGRQSQTFKIFARRAAGKKREDIYITPRSMPGMKVSLHASGARQVGLTADFIRERPLPTWKSRHYDTWDEALRHGDGCFIEYTLNLLTDHLRHMPAHRSDESVIWMPAPPAGQAIELLVCTVEPCRAVRMKFLPGSAPVASAQMSDGRFLILVAREGPAGRHPNESDVADEVLRGFDHLGIDIDPTHRLLFGFNTTEGLRGWVDYAADQFLREVGRLPPT
jgi:hypothetical protein